MHMRIQRKGHSVSAREQRNSYATLLTTLPASGTTTPRCAEAELQRSVYSRLKVLLMDYRFVRGEQLQVAALANRLQTSATPVREALHRLHGEGFLEWQPNYGFFAKVLSVREVVELYEFGYTLVRLAVAKGIEAPAPGHAAAIEAIVRELAQLARLTRDEPDACRLRIEQVFQRLVWLAPNGPALAAFRNFQDRTHHLRLLDLERPRQLERCIENLRIVADAVKARDTAAALAVLHDREKQKMRVLPELIKEVLARPYA